MKDHLIVALLIMVFALIVIGMPVLALYLWVYHGWIAGALTFALWLVLVVDFTHRD